MTDPISFYEKMWQRKSAAQGVPVTLRRKEIVRLIREYTSGKNLKLLDLGCGRGHLSLALTRFGQVTAVDFARQTIIDNQVRFHNVLFKCADITDPQLPSIFESKFDVIVSSEVVEHLEIASREIFCNNIKELSNPNGLIIITTPYMDTLLKLKRQDETEQAFRSRIDNQPVSNIMFKSELLDLLARYFEILEFSSVYPLVTKRWLDLLWKGLLWPIEYRLVNRLTQRFSVQGQYMVVVCRNTQHDS